jgi:4-hydroxybenzoate polyprenyltransferase
MVILQVQIRWELLLIIYLLIQCLFNYNHYKEINIDLLSKSTRSLYLIKYVQVLPLITIVYGTGSFLLIIIFGNVLSLIFAIALLIIGLLFTKIFKKWTSKITGFKTFYTASTLSLLVVIFTAFYCSYKINSLLFFLFILFFFRFIIGTGFSDIKDIEVDRNQNLKTLPIYYGKEKFLTMLQFLNIFSFIPFVFTLSIIHRGFSLMIFFTYIYTFIYIQKAKNKTVNIQNLTNVYVDGEFIFWPILLFIGLLCIV